MADFIRFRFHGAHGASKWDYKYIPDVDDTDIEDFRESTEEAKERQGCFNRMEVEPIPHPGNEWLLNEVQKLKSKAKEMESLAYRFESMDTDRNKAPIMHHSV